MSRSRGAHLYVDESKAHAYILVAVAVASVDVSRARAHMRGLRHRGASDIHMKPEGREHRQKVLRDLRRYGFTAHIVVMQERGPDSDRREACLGAVYALAQDLGASRIVLEEDQSIARWDRKVMFDLDRRAGEPRVANDWARRRTEPLLWAADAIAWAYGRGGVWLREIDPLVITTTRL